MCKADLLGGFCAPRLKLLDHCKAVRLSRQVHADRL